MISRFVDDDKLPPPVTVKLQPGKFCLKRAKLYLLDKDNDLAEKPLKFHRDGSVSFELSANNVVYIEQ